MKNELSKLCDTEVLTSLEKNLNKIIYTFRISDFMKVMELAIKSIAPVAFDEDWVCEFWNRKGCVWVCTGELSSETFDAMVNTFRSILFKISDANGNFVNYLKGEKYSDKKIKCEFDLINNHLRIKE